MKIFYRKNIGARRKMRRPLYEGRRSLSQTLTKFVTVVLGIGLLFGAWTGFRHIGALSLDELQVTGDLKHISKEEVAALSGLNPGQNLFSIDLGEVSSQLLKHPWVERVRLRRIFPHALRIEVVERTVVAMLNLDGLYLIDDTGKIFKKAEPAEIKNVAVLTGFSKKDFDETPAITAGRFQDAFQFFTMLSSQPYYQEDPISEIHLDAVFGFSVTTVNRGMEIYYGKDELEIKHAKLEKFTKTEAFKTQSFLRLDLDLKGRVVARTFAGVHE